MNHKNLCKGTEKNTNSLLGITIFKDFKFRERELFWSLRSLGFPENYSRWPENLFQKIFIFKRKDAEIYFEHGKHKGHEKKLSKVREMELTLVGRNKNYSRWPENLFQKIKFNVDSMKLNAALGYTNYP